MESTLAEYCLSAIEARGDEVAFTYGDRHLTGREALEIVRSMTDELHARGIGRGTSVCVLSGNRPEAYLMQVAVQVVGARHVGLHPLSSEDDHRFILRDADAAALVYDPAKFADRAVALAGDVGLALSLGPGPVGHDLLDDGRGQAADARPVIVPAADDTSSIFYTGGTTGRPKGVVHTHRSSLFLALLVQANWQWPDRPTLLVAAPITHAAGQMIAPALAHGGRVVLAEGFDAAGFLETIERERVSVTFVVPTMLYVLLDHPDVIERDLSSLRTIVYGAAPIAPERLREALDLFGDVLFQGYGQTEIGVGALVLRKEEHQLDQPGRSASAGRTPPGITAAILDDRGVEVADGEPGELCLRSTGVMVGYWNQPELTETVLRGGWLHTADVGVRDRDGFVSIVGRMKDMIVSGGFNVYPREVEDALQSHPDVQMAAVVGIPDPKWGEAVHAVVTLARPSTVSADELRAWVKQKKGSVYAPKTVDFATQLPMTALGKVDKKSIRAQATPLEH